MNKSLTQAFGFEDLVKALECSGTNLFVQDMRDNIFSANHRNLMLQKYGYTEAMRIKIEDLI